MRPSGAQGSGGRVGFEAPGRAENIAPQGAAGKEAEAPSQHQVIESLVSILQVLLKNIVTSMVI